MQKNKKILLITGGLFFCIIVVSLALILRENSKMEPAMETFSNISGSYTKEGILYDNGSYLLFSNPKTGQTDMICDDPKCGHQISESSECGAVINAALKTGWNIYNDSLYFVSDYMSKDYWKTAIFQADLNGKNRKKVADLTEMEVVYNVAYFEDDIYVSYCNGDESETVGIYHYNLATGKGNAIYTYTKNGANLYGLAVDESGLYFSLGYTDLSVQEVEENRDNEEYIEKFRKSFVIGLNKESGKEIFRTEGAVTDYFLPCIDGSLYFVKEGAAIRYYIKERKAEKIASTERYGLCSPCTDAVYFRGYDATEGRNSAYYAYYPDTGKWKKLGESDFRIEAVFSDYVYGKDATLIPEEDQETLGYAYLETDDFLAGKFDRAKIFELQTGIE